MEKTDDRTSPKRRATGIDDVELFDTRCTKCKKRKTFTEGQYHCKFCGVMCENCSAKHQKTPKQTGHWAQKIKRIRQEVTINPTFNSIKKCEIHPSRHIKGYCLDHGELYCNDCVTDRHFDCSLEHIEVMSQELSRETHMVDARNKLVDLKIRSKIASKDKKDEISLLHKQSEKFEAYLRKFRDKIVYILDKMVETVLQDRDVFCKAEEKLIMKDVTECSDHMLVLETASRNLDDAFRSGSKPEMWIALKKLERVVTHYDEIVTKIENEKSKVVLEFVSNNHLQGLLVDPQNIGKLKVASSRLYGNDLTADDIKIVSTPTRNFRPDLRRTKTSIQHDHWKINRIHKRGAGAFLKCTTKSPNQAGLNPPEANTRNHVAASSEHDYGDKGVKEKIKFGPVFGSLENVKMTYLGRKEIYYPNGAENTCVTGSTFLPNGQLALVDTYTKNLKLLNGNFELISCIDLRERPWNITHCYKSVVAVSYPYDNSVELIATGQDMQIAGKIQTDRSCKGLAYHKTQQWLYIACGKDIEAQIQAYSLEGYLKNVIIPKPGVFLDPLYLAISDDGTKLFVSDLDNGIVGFNTNSGDLICQYQDSRIKRYWDLTLDSQGRLYIVTTEPNCIYVLMGEHNGQLLTEFRNGQKPCSLSYSSIEKSLIVTSWEAKDLEVIKLE